MQGTVALCQSQLLCWLCLPLAPEPASLSASQPGFMSQGLSCIHCKTVETVLPTWERAGKGALGEGTPGGDQRDWINSVHPEIGK
jgi:hypothetical protein